MKPNTISTVTITMKIKYLLAILLVVVSASFVQAQEPKTDEAKSVVKKTMDYSSDHVSIESIIKATYASISGAKGEERDWDRFRALFHPDARLIPTGKNAEGVLIARPSTPDQYMKNSGPFLIGNGFYEQEIASKVESFGNIAHVFSTYEGRNSLSDEKPFLRGINSFQLINDGKRWWVMSIFWLAESTDNPLPEKYLP